MYQSDMHIYLNKIRSFQHRWLPIVFWLEIMDFDHSRQLHVDCVVAQISIAHNGAFYR